MGLDRAAVLEESRRNERELAAKNAELLRATRLKSEFLANMCHELRTPLNAIIGFSDLILSGQVGELEPQHREFLEAVLRNGRHLLSLINSILDLSKIEAGRMTLALAHTDLREAITGRGGRHRQSAEPPSGRNATSTWTRRCTSWPMGSGSARSCSTCCPTPPSSPPRAGDHPARRPHPGALRSRPSGPAKSPGW